MKCINSRNIRTYNVTMKGQARVCCSLYPTPNARHLPQLLTSSQQSELCYKGMYAVLRTEDVMWYATIHIEDECTYQTFILWKGAFMSTYIQISL